MASRKNSEKNSGELSPAERKTHDIDLLEGDPAAAGSARTPVPRLSIESAGASDQVSRPSSEVAVQKKKKKEWYIIDPAHPRKEMWDWMIILFVVS